MWMISFLSLRLLLDNWLIYLTVCVRLSFFTWSVHSLSCDCGSSFSVSSVCWCIKYLPDRIGSDPCIGSLLLSGIDQILSFDALTKYLFTQCMIFPCWGLGFYRLLSFFLLVMRVNLLIDAALLPFSRIRDRFWCYYLICMTNSLHWFFSSLCSFAAFSWIAFNRIWVHPYSIF